MIFCMSLYCFCLSFQKQMNVRVHCVHLLEEAHPIFTCPTFYLLFHSLFVVCYIYCQQSFSTKQLPWKQIINSCFILVCSWLFALPLFIQFELVTSLTYKHLIIASLQFINIRRHLYSRSKCIKLNKAILKSNFAYNIFQIKPVGTSLSQTGINPALRYLEVNIW